MKSIDKIKKGFTFGLPKQFSGGAQLKAMTFSTEYFDVQKALGFKNESMSQSAFKALDEQYAPRIQRGEKDGILAIFVDNRLVLCQQNGENVAADEAEVKEFFNF